MCLVTNSGHSRQLWQVRKVYFTRGVRYVDLMFRAVLMLCSFISSGGVQESQSLRRGLVWSMQFSNWRTKWGYD